MLIFSLVIISSVLLVLENPLEDPYLPKFTIIKNLNILITISFVMEIILKVIVYGFVFNGETSYLKNGWNYVDIIVILTGLIEFFVTASSHIELRIFRAVFRPLKLINAVKSMKTLI